MAWCFRCGEGNPERARFCMACGVALSALPEATGQDERKVVSVLFCDLVGFTARSDNADPEDVRAVLRPYLFASLGARPAVAESNAWLAQSAHGS